MVLIEDALYLRNTHRNAVQDAEGPGSEDVLFLST